MPKLVFLIKRNPTFSHDEFRAYYEDHHVELALRYIGAYLLDYRRSYPTANFSFSGKVDAGGPPPPPPWEYDCITEMWFENKDKLSAMLAHLAQPDVRAIVTADEEHFIDRKLVVALSVDEYRTHLGTAA